MTGTSSRYDLRSNAVDSKRDRETKQKWGPNALKGERILHQDLHTVSNKQRPANSRDRYVSRTNTLRSVLALFLEANLK